MGTIKECNFKANKTNMVGGTVDDCILCNPKLFTGVSKCVGEQNCILYQMYRRIEESDI
jgi:hypothetical protein